MTPDAVTATVPLPTQSVYQNRVADYWNAEANPVNLELGRIDDLYHHHYGVGEADWTVLDEPDPELRKARVTAELHRLEHAQAELLAARLGRLTPSDRVFDAGCGRGGGSVVAHLRHEGAMSAANFDRWLALWQKTTGDILDPDNAAALQAKAARIAESLQLGVQFQSERLARS